MKNIFLFLLSGILTITACNSRHEEKAESEQVVNMAPPPAQESMVSSDMAAQPNSMLKEKAEPLNNFISSSAAVEAGTDTFRKFIRTADLKFKVKSVINSTYRIENITRTFNGFVTETKLNSTIDNKTIVPVSADSSLETTYYTVSNTIVLRVPKTKLDTTLKTIAALIDYLDYRVIQAKDVSLDILSNRLKQLRLATYRKRVTGAIDTKGKKLRETSEAEDGLLNRQEEADNSHIANLELNDKIQYSTINLLIYQRETVKRELIANNKNIDAFEPSLGVRLLESLKFGWMLLEGFLLFLMKLWAFILLGILAYILYRRYGRVNKK